MGPDHLTPDLPVALTAITAQLHLLQRRLLRADGLSNLERDLLLGTVATVLTSVRDLELAPIGGGELGNEPYLEAELGPVIKGYVLPDPPRAARGTAYWRKLLSDQVVTLQRLSEHSVPDPPQRCS